MFKISPVRVVWWVGSLDFIFWGGRVIRISTGSAVGWAIGWAPANYIFCLCQLKCVQDNIMYMHTAFIHHIRFIRAKKRVAGGDPIAVRSPRAVACSSSKCNKQYKRCTMLHDSCNFDDRYGRGSNAKGPLATLGTC